MNAITMNKTARDVMNQKGRYSGMNTLTLNAARSMTAVLTRNTWCIVDNVMKCPVSGISGSAIPVSPRKRQNKYSKSKKPV